MLKCMKEINPPRFLILTMLAAFFFAFTAGVMFLWPQARAKAIIAEQAKP